MTSSPSTRQTSSILTLDIDQTQVWIMSTEFHHTRILNRRTRFLLLLLSLKRMLGKVKTKMEAPGKWPAVCPHGLSGPRKVCPAWCVLILCATNPPVRCLKARKSLHYYIISQRNDGISCHILANWGSQNSSPQLKENKNCTEDFFSTCSAAY